ncbi:hypothetical protein SAMN05660462_00583 [Proteiniborus ethanoligenes]|uniref:Uncharacterized protein n=1 Tax=Proteiniborus ethanoligenes TaxID=415015 RepID=A0A1H3LQK0_9FIRM|nr:hypothetical protein [Proteiniborus ethanoligenes]SDY66248.1 hypothetical protein SAMN05660462_00583 [Proteiniborus ethanoligenes]
MQDLFCKYSLYELNEDMQKFIEGHKVNNLKMFIASEKSSKLSITINPDKSTDDMYHGLHPRFDEEQLRLFLDKLTSNDVKSFWEAIDEIQNQDIKLMNLIFSESEVEENFLIEIIEDEKLKENLEISLLGKAVLQMASHFGYRIYIDEKNIYDEFKSYINSFFKGSKIFFDYCDKTKEVKLLGIWPKDMIGKLCLEYYLDQQEGKLILKKGKKEIHDNFLYLLLNFEGEWESFFTLLTSDVYYSGVMPCVKKIDYEINPSLSQKIKYLVFNVIRTTYATVDTMDNSQILKHPFFEGEHGERLAKLDNYEDILQNKYLYSNQPKQERKQRDYEEKMILNLNKYLKYSLNTHTIAVSSNLITEDGYLIAGKRGALNIDAGEYYCSSNGQTEFRDENVNFYRKSVFEDMPTMDYFSKYRVDLTKEIERECIAELGVVSYGIGWNYYGVSYLSINNFIDENDDNSIQKSKEIKSRRMHFNVLTSNSISQTFKEVIKTHRTATESFENESIVGIKTRVFKSKIDFLKSMGLSLYYWISENKSKIFLLLILISILIGKQNYSSVDISNYFDILLLLVYLIISVFTWYKDRKIRKQMILKCYYLPSCFLDNKFKMEKVLKKLSKKAGNGKFHAIFSIMYILHFLSLTEDNDI